VDILIERAEQAMLDRHYIDPAEGSALNSNPEGVFETAAIKAISRVRYQPVKRNGKPIAVGTKFRVAFRLSAR
jgi:outer membrane biosynthesis protein TonB